MTHHYCTYFDGYYLPRALALHRSLVRHDRDFVLWTLCLDDETADQVEALMLDSVRVVRLGAVEQSDPEAAATRAERTTVEYYFTIGPSFMLHLFAIDPTISQLTYLDADLWFFSDPQPVFDEIGAAPVAIVEHRFAPALVDQLQYGRFNVAWISFARSDIGHACLRWWRDHCVEWCFDRVEPTRFADQKYLDQWPALFEGVHIIGHLGVDAAPWNIANEPITMRGGLLFIGDQPLVVFHFQGLKQRTKHYYDANLAVYGARLTKVVREQVYEPYLRELAELATSPASLAHGHTRPITGPAAEGVRAVLRLVRAAANGQLVRTKGRLR